MEVEEYRRRGKEMVDYIADYLENIRDRRVFPDVKPGYMHNILPDSAPIEGEKWENIFNDIERVIMPGVTHWQSPHMHAYFPALNSFPSLLGDMLADAINCIGFTWASSPACTELETIVMNWLGKMIGLPNEFLHMDNNSKGGGVLQTTASESTLVCLLAGRTQAIKKFHEKTSGFQDAEINARLVAYCSDQAHSSVEKAALIGLVRMRYIESDENLSMRGKLLQDAIEDDIKQGLIPFWVCNTLGTTGACAFDNLDEVGNVCRQYNLWLHIDAAYAGSAFICPEYRTWLKGIEKADSIGFNPSKWLMVHFDCSALWLKDSTAVHRTFNVEPLYLQHENSGLAIDYMHWQIPLSKRFRALKLWFVLRSFGIKGLQKHIREGVRLAQKFEALVLADPRFEISAQRHLGLVVFRIKGENELTERLLKRLNHRGNLHCVPASLKGKYIIRFAVTSTNTTTDDILNDWAEIKNVTTEILNELNVKIDREKVPLKDIKDKNEAFGSSLILSNSPMSPKIVNGSFAAIFDADEFLAKTYAGIRIAHQDSPSMRRRVRGIMMSGKQFSLDSRMDLVVQSCFESATNDSTEKMNPKSKPIREDSEDTWEAYESPGTPPTTPPPTVSPMLPLTPTQTMPSGMKFEKILTLMEMETMKLHQDINVGYEKVLVPTKPNTLTIPKISTTFYSFDKKNSLNNTNRHQCCDSQTVNNLLSNNNNQNKNSLNKLETLNASTIKNILNESSNSTTATVTNNINYTGSKPKISNYTSDISSINNVHHTKQHSTLTTSSWLAKENQTTSKTEIYHGKRFLEPLYLDGGICAFYNLGFDITMTTVPTAPPQSEKSEYSPNSISFRRNIYAFDKQMSEIFEEDEDSINVDWDGIKENFNNQKSEKIKSQINKKSLEWTSLDCSEVYLTEGQLYEIDGATAEIVNECPLRTENIDIEKDECCEKCGHRTTGSSSGTESNSSSSYTSS